MTQNENRQKNQKQRQFEPPRAPRAPRKAKGKINKNVVEPNNFLSFLVPLVVKKVFVMGSKGWECAGIRRVYFGW
jgi:hypothetical protein